MFQLGYIKDSLALFFFTFVICKIYNLNHKNLENIKNEFIIYFIIAFITDFSFTLYPQFHYTNVGYNREIRGIIDNRSFTKKDI